MRLENVATPITPAAFTTERFSSWIFEGAPAETVGSDMSRILAERPQGVYRCGDFIAVALLETEKVFVVRSTIILAKELVAKAVGTSPYCGRGRGSVRCQRRDSMLLLPVRSRIDTD